MKTGKFALAALFGCLTVSSAALAADAPKEKAAASPAAAATDEDVCQAYRETGRSMPAAAREVRKLIAEVNDGPDEPDPTVPLPEAAHRREACFRSH